MTFALSSFVADGVERDEAVTRRFRQRLLLNITAANTDYNLDLGTYAGTFWTAVSGTEPGATALKAIKEIQLRASAFFRVGGSGIAPYAQADASIPTILGLTSAASSGGAATEALTVTGLATTDTILSVSQKDKGANSTALIGYSTVITNGLTGIWTGNPGANAVLQVIVQRTVTAVQAGTYQLSLDGTNTYLPNILYASGDAPTAYSIAIEWYLAAGQQPVQISG